MEILASDAMADNAAPLDAGVHVAPDGAPEVTDVAGDLATDLTVSADVDGTTNADATDAPPDAPPGAPWGPISGAACGGLTAALESPQPSFHTTTWDIQVDAFDPALLVSPGPKQRFEEPNAGGSSKCSEIFSMTWLIACEGAQFYKLETEISYDVSGAITDFEVIIGGDKIGVSVTRAYLGPFNMSYTADDADTLLTNKLSGVNESTANVSANDAWTKQILHIWTLQPEWVPILESAWQGLEASLKSDTVVLVTVEAGSEFVVTDACDD